MECCFNVVGWVRWILCDLKFTLVPLLESYPVPAFWSPSCWFPENLLQESRICPWCWTGICLLQQIRAGLKVLPTSMLPLNSVPLHHLFQLKKKCCCLGPVAHKWACALHLWLALATSGRNQGGKKSSIERKSEMDEESIFWVYFYASPFPACICPEVPILFQ